MVMGCRNDSSDEETEGVKMRKDCFDRVSVGAIVCILLQRISSQFRLTLSFLDNIFFLLSFVAWFGECQIHFTGNISASDFQILATTHTFKCSSQWLKLEAPMLSVHL